MFALLLVGVAFFPAAGAATTSSNGSTLSVGVVTTNPIESMSAFDNVVNTWVNPTSIGAIENSIFQLPYFWAPANNSYTGVIVNSTDTYTQNDTYILHLNHSGWSNGQPVTAWDFYAEFLVDSAIGAPAYNISVIDNYTVSVVVPNIPKDSLYGLSQSSFIFGPDNANTFLTVPYDQWKPIVDDIVGNYSAVQALNQTVLTKLQKLIYAYSVSNPIFNGAYYPTAVSPSEIVLSKNPYYIYADKMSVDQVILYQFTSPNTLYQYLDSGQLSLFYTYGGSSSGTASVVPTSFASKIPSYMEQVNVDGYGGPGLTFNNDSGVVSNLNVREAIAYALNRTEVAETGGSVYSALQYPIGMPTWMQQTYCTQTCLSAMNPYGYNLTAAANAMKAAGYTLQSGVWTSKNGTQATVTLLNTVSTDPTWVDMALDIQTQLKNFGINVNVLNPASPGTYLTSGTGFDIMMYNWGYWLTAWDVYRNVAWLNGYPYPDMHFTANVSVPFNGIGNVNPITLMYTDLNGAITMADEVNYTQALAWMVDHYLPYLPIAGQAAEIFANTKQFNWPSPSSPIWSTVLSSDDVGMAVNFQINNQFSAVGAASTSITATTATATTSPSTTATTGVSTTTATTTAAPSTSASLTSTTAQSVTSTADDVSDNHKRHQHLEFHRSAIHHRDSDASGRSGDRRLRSGTNDEKTDQGWPAFFFFYYPIHRLGGGQAGCIMAGSQERPHTAWSGSRSRPSASWR